MKHFSESHIEQIRSRFPALDRIHQGDQRVVYLDGPAGTQVPLRVANRIRDALLHHNANRSGRFATSNEVDRLVDEAQRAGADWFGAEKGEEIVFGPNMTSLTFQFSRAIARTWQPGDEVLLTHLDHDANFTPWKLAAQERGVHVRIAEICPEDASLNEDSFQKLLSEKTRLVAFTAASNSSGSRTDIAKLTRIAKDCGALVYVDAVHYAPHGRIDVTTWGCDFVICSAYKFFGPHIGMLWGKYELLEKLTPYKLRPAPETVPAKWMTGTQNHACLAGVTEAIDYVAGLASESHLSRKQQLDQSFRAIEEYEQSLVQRLLVGLEERPFIRIFGITQSERLHQRVPTVTLTMQGMESGELARRLGEIGIYAWHGHYYAINLCEQLQQGLHGMLRIGLMHYNTSDEVDRTLEALDTIFHSKD